MKRMDKIWSAVMLTIMMTVLICGAALGAETVNTEHPENVKFHLYDYWVTSQNDEDTPVNAQGAFEGTSYNHVKTGINDGHALLFMGNGGGLQYGWWNARTAGRLVKPYLVNGYPELDLDKTNHTDLNYSFPAFDPNLKVSVFKSSATDTIPKGYSWENTPDGTAAYSSGAAADESLAYLFSQEDGNGKKYYPASRLLMKEEDKGKYYFDSRNHFAQFDTSSGSFTLYDRTDVPEGTDQYRFFPFNTQQQFEQQWGTDGTRFGMNHFFGVMMEVEFYQTPDGKITLADGTKEDMIFHFSGDDDVFVFVDNLLVGSVGGIHGRRAIDINFATGVVTQERDGMAEGADGSVVVAVNNNSSTVANAQGLGSTTIKDYYNMAKSAPYNYTGDLLNHDGYENELTENGTLQPNTRHTLRMYYLERGNWDSNMEISFNLFYPYNKLSVSNTIEGGNETLRNTDFIYDLEFDMSGVIPGLVTSQTAYDYEVYDASGEEAVQEGTVTIIDGKITAISRTKGNTNAYLDASSRAYLSNGERVVFNLPDAAEVKVTQNQPAIPQGLSMDPYELAAMTVTPTELKISDTKPTAEGKVMAASYPTSVAYRNVVRTGSLKIIKNIEKLGENLPKEDQAFVFDVTVPAIGQATGKSYPATLTATVKAGETTAETALLADVVLGAPVTIAEKTDGLEDKSFLYLEGNGTYRIESDEQTMEIMAKNLYAAAVSVTLSGHKTLDGAVPQAEKFSFLIESGSEGTLMPEQRTVFNDEEGKFSFGPIVYDRPGVYKYRISEVWGDDPYIDYDTQTVYQVVVTVEANTEGGSIGLKATTKITKEGDESEANTEIAFANYTRGGVQLKLRKLSSYDDRVLPGAEFALTHDPAICPVCRKEAPALMALGIDGGEQTQETEGPTLDTENITEQTAVTDQYGAIIFRGLIEGHVYTLTETKAPQDYNLPEKSTWTVVNNGNTLMIDNEPLSSALVIHNRPTYWPVEIGLYASKTMEGRVPYASEKFGFVLRDERGNVIREAENVLGEIRFAPIVIEKAGTHRFDIVEVPGRDDDIWYDKTVYTVTIEVSGVVQPDRPDEGMLEIVSITYEKDGMPYRGERPIFANARIPDLPPTGDDMDLGLWLAIMGVSAGSALLIRARRRRKIQ